MGGDGMLGDAPLIRNASDASAASLLDLSALELSVLQQANTDACVTSQCSEPVLRSLSSGATAPTCMPCLNCLRPAEHVIKSHACQRKGWTNQANQHP